MRAAVRSDARRIKALIDRVGINPTGLDWNRFIVAVREADDGLVGCGQVKPHGGEILELASIAVAPEFRGMGIGRAIIQQLLDRNPRPLYLMCMSHNGPLYEKFGFVTLPPDRMPRYFLRIHRLFDAAKRLGRTGESLLVMKLE